MRLPNTLPYIESGDILSIVKEVRNTACIAELVGDRFALIIRSGQNFRVLVCGTIQDAIKCSGTQLSIMFNKE